MTLAFALALSACSEPAPAPAAAGRSTMTAALSIDDGDEARPVVVAQLPEAVAATLPEGKVSEQEGRGVLVLSLAEIEDAPAILGKYERTGTRLSFVPAVPLSPGKHYTATLRAGDEVITREYQRAAAASQPTQVVNVDPGLDALPSNILRFYAEFSAPMQGGDGFYEHVHLVDLTEDKPVEMAWREIQLWSPDRKRLTLLVHPGRVKRDITFSKDMGPVLLAGHRYELRLDPELLDATGQPLAQAHRYTFEVDESDDEGPDPGAWAVEAPAPNSTDAVTLRFDEAMDAELLRTRIRVLDESSAPIDGNATVAGGARAFTFVPATPWRPGDYQFSFSGELEDLAGNTSTAPFDRPSGFVPKGEPVLSVGFSVGG